MHRERDYPSWYTQVQSYCWTYIYKYNIYLYLFLFIYISISIYMYYIYICIYILYISIYMYIYQSTHNYKTCIKELCACVERGVQSLAYQNNACFQKHVLNNKGRRTQHKDHSELFWLLIYLNLQFSHSYYRMFTTTKLDTSQIRKWTPHVFNQFNGLYKKEARQKPG